MVKLTKIIRRKYSDFFTIDDYFEGKRSQKNLLVTDLDKKGRVLNPKAPCVVTVIDDQYTGDANLQKGFRKFKVKSDVLKLREITRHKFFIYATQQRALEKTREQHLHSIMYKQTRRFVKISSQQLNIIKNEVFSSMLAANKKIETFLQFDISEKVKQSITIHQRLSMEVKDVHKRFLFLLKLIAYFSISKEGICVLELTEMANTSDWLFLNSDLNIENITDIQTEKLKKYIATSVKPCISEEKYLNVDFWIEGYTNTRLKLFDYYKQFTKLAIHDHVFSIIYSKFINVHSCRIVKPIPRNTPHHFLNRTKCLQRNTFQLLKMSERQQAKSNIHRHIKGLAPVVLKKIQLEEMGYKASDESNEMIKLEKMHTILLGYLGKLDDLEPGFCKQKEKEVRKLIARERERSRKVLIKVNRFQNWIEHYKKH